MNASDEELIQQVVSVRQSALSLKGLGGRLLRNGAAVFSLAMTGQADAVTGYVPTGASKVAATAMGTAADAVKRYSVTCYNDGSGEPTQLRARVQGQTTTAKFLLKIVVEKDGVQQEQTDPKNGKGLNFSPYAVVAGGPGKYTMTVSKVKKKSTDANAVLKGAMTFITQQECNTAKGASAYTGIKKPVAIK